MPRVCYRQITNINKSLCVHKYIHTNEYIEHLNNNNKHNNTHIQTIVKDFSRSREREPSISGMFVRLNVFKCKKAEQSDRRSLVSSVSRY